MAPYFSDSGEMNPESPDLYTDVTDHITEADRQQQEDRERREQIGLGKKPEPADPKGAGKPAGEPSLTREQQGDRWEAMRARLIAEPGLAEDAAFMAEYAAMGSGAMGHGEEGQKPMGELFEGARIRELGTAALDPAPRPALTEGTEWDEGALVLAETEAAACGLAPHTVMTMTADLAQAVEAADVRGVDWTPELGEAELIRLHGREGAQRMADDARAAIEIIVETEHGLLAQRVRELARDYGDDPNVIMAFAKIYNEIASGTPTPKLEALLLRRAEKSMQAEAKAKAEGEKIRRDQEANAAEADAASLAATELAHRRWRRTEPR